MSFVLPNPYANYPPRWDDFLANAEKVTRSNAFTTQTEVYRFGNRYRLANSFRRLELDGYSAQTSAGYDALTRCALFYSAFEKFQDATNVHLHHFNGDMDPEPCLRDLRAADPQLTFMRFIYAKLTKNSEKAQWLQFLRGESCSPLTLAKGVRHIYLHGDLTPGARNTDPATAAAICDRLALAVKRPIDRVFVQRVQLLADAP
jgi:hypothetical protein